MSDNIYSIFEGTGSYIASRQIKNDYFLDHEFYDAEGNRLEAENRDIINKFFKITDIMERRYVTDDLVTSDIAYYAAENAIESAAINREDLDYIIVAHNFGDVSNENKRQETVPSIASRVKHKLKITNPYTVAYDVIFGCPGWLEGIIQANSYIKSGIAKKVLVIGAEVLSRVSDPHDIDSMLYADGAGAVILKAQESDTPIGIIGHKSRCDTIAHSKMLHMSRSYNPGYEDINRLFLKMNGHAVYKYALEKVPESLKACLDECNIPLNQVRKLLIHQANGKMDEAILKKLYNLFDAADLPEYIMPMTIELLGNSSVATLPTLFDRVLKGKLEGFKILQGETLLFASVGAGMNINSMVYMT